MTGRLLRMFAIAIAIVAVVDPAITSTRRSKPLVAVVAGDGRADADAADQVASALRSDYVVVRAALPAASATVVVGTRLPEFAEELAAPAFVVLPGRDRPGVAIEAVVAPRSAPLDSRVPVIADVRVDQSNGGTVEVSLLAGELIVDRTTRAIDSGDWRGRFELTYVPTAIGAARLRVVARTSRDLVSATSDLILDIRDDRWNVLFFDRRPSWLSTFVRRAVEMDPRFTVTSRVVTSRNVSTDAGRPPQGFESAGPLSGFDAIVVGAADALTESDVSGLDGYLRRRGGSVVLLFDQATPSRGAVRRLTAVGEWSTGSSRGAIPVSSVGETAGSLRAAQFIWPATLPAGAASLAKDSAMSRPIVWRSAVGAGQVIVSGALDAWHARDPDRSGFAEFWRRTIGDAAGSAAPLLDVTVETPVLAPGDRTDIHVRLRDASLAGTALGGTGRASVTATLASADTAVEVTMWSDGHEGQVRGTLRAPAVPGTYRLSVSGNGSRADIPVVVANEVSRPTPDHSALLRAWASAKGGVALGAAQIDSMSSSLTRALGGTNRSETWYPMRSVWWIIPFAFALGAEWWWRRRRGLA